MHGMLLHGTRVSVEVIVRVGLLGGRRDRGHAFCHDGDARHRHRKQSRLSSEQQQGASAILPGSGRGATGHAKRTCSTHPTRTASSLMHLPWHAPKAVAFCAGGASSAPPTRSRAPARAALAAGRHAPAPAAPGLAMAPSALA